MGIDWFVNIEHKQSNIEHKQSNIEHKQNLNAQNVSPSIHRHIIFKNLQKGHLSRLNTIQGWGL